MFRFLVNSFNKRVSILAIALGLGLSGCGSDSDSVPPAGPTPTPSAQTISVSGGGVKGPLANAVVTVYAFDPTKAGFQGAAVATAATDSSAAITGLSLPTPLDPPYIMEFTGTPGTTTDITTGAFPVITTMRTVATQAMLDSGEQIYATPLTTVATDIAVSNAADTNGTPGIQADEFETALTTAASQVVSTLGFGMDGSIDIFSTPPLVNSATVTADEQADVAAYRTAVEALTAITYQINSQVTGASVDTVLADLAADLADGGVIDGSAGTTLDTNTLQVLEQDPATLPIPNSPTGQTVADVQTILADETATTGVTTDTTDLTDGTITTVSAPAETDPDIDADGVLNADDAFPEDPSETVDSDGDGIGDVADPDDDNDGILDVDEGTTPAPTATDTDGDGFDDEVDNCPANFNPAQTNTDGDTEGDACDTDDDGDSVADVDDAFPLDDTESVDTDGDGSGNVADTDDDNDGVEDAADTGVSPLDGTTACSLLKDCDGDGVLDGADFNPTDDTVTINFAPVAVNDTASADEDAATFAIDVTANDSDDDGNPTDVITLTAIGTNDTSLGTAVINGNNIDYTPVAEQSGTDIFTYTVSDGTVSSTATVEVTITPVNDNPVTVDDDASTNEDVPVTTVNVLANDSDVDGDTLTATLLANATSGNVIDNGDGTFTYTPNPDFNGADSFTYTAIDGNGGSAMGAVNITVESVNDNPVANSDAATTDEDTPVTTVDVTLNDTDVDSVAVLSVLPGDPVASNGTVVNNNDGTFTYTPNADYFGDDSFTYNLSDGTTGTAVGTVIVTILPVNDDPVAVLDEVTTDEDTSVSTGNVTLNDSDVDGDSLTAELLANAGSGNVVKNGGSAGSFTYTPDPDFCGEDSFAYTLSDGNGGTATGTVDITVDCFNDAPVAADDSKTTDEDVAVITDDVRLNDTDIDGDALTATLLANAANGNVTDNGDGTFTYTPNPDFNGADSFTYTLSDGFGGTDTGTVNITVVPVNDAPIANADAASAGVLTETVVDVLANDTDVDGDTLTITAVSTGSRGGTIVNNGSSISFTDTTGTEGTETFTYDVSDGTVTLTGIPVTMTVTANAPPVANPDFATTDENTPVTTDNVLANDTDGGDGPGALSIESADTTSVEGGTVVNNGDGTFTYTPPLDFDGEDTFTYTVTDTASTSVGTVTVTVLNTVNELPVANDDSDSTLEDTPFTTINVLANDTDSDGPSPLFVDSADTISAVGGIVVNNGDGTFDYTPPLNFVGMDSFYYSVSDGLDTALGFVSINVTDVNDEPVAGDDAASTTVDTPVTTVNVLLNDVDVDGDALSIASADTTSVQGGSVVNNGDGTFTYTPPGGYTGEDSFTYTVTDSLLSAIGTVTIMVMPDGIPIDMTVLMSAAEGGVAGIDERGPDEYEYWTDNWDPATELFTFIDYSYNHGTDAFDVITGNSDLYLSGGAWVNEGNIYATDDGSGGLDASIRAAGDDSAEVARVRVTAFYLDIAGELIADYLDSVWQAAMIDPAAVFNTGAKLITEYRFEQLMDSYNMWVNDWCEFSDPVRYSTLNNNCNGVNVDVSVNSTGYAQALDEVIVATAWVDPDDYSTPPGAISIAWEGSTTLMVELVSDGTANYYVVDWSSADGASRVAPAVAGTDWVRNTDPGVDMLRIQVPSSFVAQFPGDLEESLNYFMAVQDGFVRQGVKDVVGDIGFDSGVLNGNAMSDILDNFSAPPVPDLTDLAGTWVRSYPSISGDYPMTHFFTSGHYESSGTCDIDGSTGMEYGTFTWDSVTGVTTGTQLVSTMGACSPALLAASGSTMFLTGDTLTLYVPGFGGVTYNRLQASANPIVGSWVAGDIANPGEFGLGGHVILTFLDDTTLSLSEECTSDGVDVAGFEYGSYTWDAGVTDALSGTLDIDSNGSCGLHDSAGFVFSGFTVTVSGDTMTLTPPGGGDVILSRHGGGVPALTCGYETPWGSGAPLIFNSYDDFAVVVADCGGVLPTVEADVIGSWEETWTDTSGIWVETVVFNGDGSGSFTETLDGVEQGTGAFTWSLVGDEIWITNGTDFRDIWVNTPSGIKVYTEETSWGADLVPDATADGEIWNAYYTKL